MDQVVGDARVFPVHPPDLVQDPAGFPLVPEGGIGGCRRTEERQSVEGGELLLVRVAVVQLPHRFGVPPGPFGVGSRAAVATGVGTAGTGSCRRNSPERRCSRLRAASSRRSVAPARWRPAGPELLVGRRGPDRVVPGHGDAPVGDAAAGVPVQHRREDAAGLLVEERVEESHRSLELGLDAGIARRRKLDRPDLAQVAERRMALFVGIAPRPALLGVELVPIRLVRIAAAGGQSEAERQGQNPDGPAARIFHVPLPRPRAPYAAMGPLVTRPRWVVVLMTAGIATRTLPGVVDEPVRGGLPEPSFYALSGIDQARDRLRGMVPRSPLSHLVGYRLTQIGSGTATMTMPASPWFQMVDGITLGAPLVVEEAPAIAVLTGAPSATEVVTTALSLNHFRPPTLDSSSFIARARVVNTVPPSPWPRSSSKMRSVDPSCTPPVPSCCGRSTRPRRPPKTSSPSPSRATRRPIPTCGRPRPATSSGGG